jgi:hypothetical protein
MTNLFKTIWAISLIIFTLFGKLVPECYYYQVYTDSCKTEIVLTNLTIFISGLFCCFLDYQIKKIKKKTKLSTLDTIHLYYLVAKAFPKRFLSDFISNLEYGRGFFESLHRAWQGYK